MHVSHKTATAWKNASIAHAMDLHGYQESGEFDLLAVRAQLNERTYECCPTPYQDLTFELVFRRRCATLHPDCAALHSTLLRAARLSVQCSRDECTARSTVNMNSLQVD